ncbi:MAG: threonine aldolase family protein [Lachnospiraceae bacterium]
MIRFNNDYNHGAHPEILRALADTNHNSYGGYGKDEWCEKAVKEIQKYLGDADTDIHFLVGGTQTNFIVIASALRPYQSVISADSGHINVHETGAVENCGHKVQTLPGKDGKISAKQIRQLAKEYQESGVQEHITCPGMVYLSFPTEYGTIYSKKELEEISAVCKEYEMYLFVDGARMGYGLAAPDNDVSLKDLAKLADVFYLGGTKCGAMFGEALVISNPLLKKDFRSYMKQNGAMLAKGWLLGVQFYTLFRDGLYFEITKKAVDFAMQIKKAFAEKGIPFFVESSTNQQFVVLTASQMKALEKDFIFEFEEKIGEDHFCVRFCTSWSTEQEEVDILIRKIAII